METMSTKRLALSLVLSMLTMTAGHASAQSSTGAQPFNNDTVSAFTMTSDLSISVFAQRTESPLGTNGFAVINVFDFSTFMFSQCVTSNFDLRISNARATLSFTTDGGFNCSSGQPVAVTCQPTSQSGVFHNVTNGTANIPVFDQRYTTHGLIDSFTNLSCALTVSGTQYPNASGGASTERLNTTP